MPQIQNVSEAAGLKYGRPRSFANCIFACQQQRRIDVPLQRNRIAEHGTRRGEVRPPIDAYDVCARLAELFEQVRRALGVEYFRHAGTSQSSEYFLCCWKFERRVLLGPQFARPGIEELHHRGPSLDL